MTYAHYELIHSYEQTEHTVSVYIHRMNFTTLNEEARKNTFNNEAHPGLMGDYPYPSDPWPFLPCSLFTVALTFLDIFYAL